MIPLDKWRQRLKDPACACALWVALCFALTSAVYLSWLDRLVALTDGAAADWISMAAGYLLQAAGLGLAALALHRDPDGDMQRPFAAASALFAATSVPALLARAAAPAIGFGLAMNLFCGAISGFYLCAIGRTVDAGSRARTFGGGYAVATVAVGLMTLPGRGRLVYSGWALLLYLPLAAAMALTARPLRAASDEAYAPAREPADDAEAPLALACAAVVLVSAVKNLGFSFPSADIAAGLVPALTRLPYAVGLAAAGFITDRRRKDGMVCAVAALALPFIMLGLVGEPVPAAICWGLDYLFYGVFSVFRVVLFLDIAGRSRRWALAPLGLLMGRLGDVAGTAVGLLLAGHRLALVAATALAFFPTVYLFYRLYQRLYEPQAVYQRSEQEVFEAFCLHNDLSAREREVLRMVLDSHANGEIAEALFITESTVKYHVRNVLQKTGCKNRGELQRKFTLALYPQLKAGSAALAGTQR